MTHKNQGQQKSNKKCCGSQVGVLHPFFGEVLITIRQHMNDDGKTHHIKAQANVAPHLPFGLRKHFEKDPAIIPQNMHAQSVPRLQGSEKDEEKSHAMKNKNRGQ